MKALVTGATGFVGGHLVEALGRRGVEVTALIRSPAKAGTLRTAAVRQVPGDLHDGEALARAVAGQDVIFHVAGLIAARGEAEFRRANVEGTAHLVEAAVQGGTRPRFILVSSMAAGGPAFNDVPLRGAVTTGPVTMYGRSKLAAEQVVRDSPLPWSILRPPMVYGPGDREVLKVFRIARWGVAPVFGDGSQRLSAIFAPDLAEALLATAESPASVGQTYYPCHPEVFTSADFVRAVGRACVASGAAPARASRVGLIRIPHRLARALLAVTGAVAALSNRPTILTPDKANEFFQSAWTGDPANLTRDTGWRARQGLDSGLRATAAWYRQAGWL